MLYGRAGEIKEFFINIDINNLYWILVSLISYYIFLYLSKKIYKGDNKKRDETIFHLKVILFTIIIAFTLEMIGVHKSWIINIVTGISVLLLLFNIGSWIIFKNYKTIKDKDKPIKDQKLIEKLDNVRQTDELFIFEGKKYKYISEKYYEEEIREKSNKTTRLYDMYLAIALFFFALLGMSMLLDKVILEDSMSSKVIVVFGVAFIIPYLKDIKYTIRFAKNPHLNFDAYIGFWINGKEVFGKIVDMNSYEIILYKTFHKVYVTISHSEVKTFTSYENGRLFIKKYIVSKDLKYKIKNIYKTWFEDFNKIYTYTDDDKNEIGVLDLNTADSFFTTEDDGHGIELTVFVKQKALDKYKFIIKKLESFIQEQADKNDWELETAKRVDLKIIDEENCDDAEK